MAALISAPIIVADSKGWISVFRTEAECLSHLEAPDVEGGEYLAFDSEGRTLRLVIDADDEPERWWQRIRYQAPVVLRVGGDRRPDLLRSLLEEALNAQSEDLPTLLRMAEGHKYLHAPEARRAR